MGEGIHTIGSRERASRSEFIAKGEEYYYQRMMSAKEKHEKLERELELNYPMYQRAADSRKGGAAKEEMRRRMKPANDALKTYEEAQKDYDRFREERERIQNQPPSAQQQRKIVTSLNDLDTKGRIVVDSDFPASEVINYTSKEDLARKLFYSLPIGFRKGLIGIRKGNNSYKPVFDKRTQKKWNRYINNNTIDTKGD